MDILENRKKVKLLDKIEKLFALANNNSNSEESARAMLKAQEMMAKYQISEKTVKRNANKCPADVINRDVKLYVSLPWWHGELATIIAGNFRCKAAIAVVAHSITKKTYKTIRFYGHSSDVDICVETFEYAIKEINRNSRKYANSFKDDPTCDKIKAIKDNYIGGFLNGLNHKYRTQVNEKHWGLVLLCPKDVTTEFGKNIKGQYTVKTPELGDYEKALQNGYMEGFRFGD